MSVEFNISFMHLYKTINRHFIYFLYCKSVKLFETFEACLILRYGDEHRENKAVNELHDAPQNVDKLWPAPTSSARRRRARIDQKSRSCSSSSRSHCFERGASNTPDFTGRCTLPALRRRSTGFYRSAFSPTRIELIDGKTLAAE